MFLLVSAVDVEFQPPEQMLFQTNPCSEAWRSQAADAPAQAAFAPELVMGDPPGELRLEYVGPDLAQRRPDNIPQALKDVASALCVIHSVQLVHMNVSPQNLCVRCWAITLWTSRPQKILGSGPGLRG